MRWCSTSVRRTNAPIEQMAHPNCNDQIAAMAFGSTEHVSPLDFDRLRTFDAVFATMWKVRESFESRWMEVLHRLKDETNVKVVLFQEAETSWPMTRSWEEQQDFIALLKKVDLFLTHNERDTELWGTFTLSCDRWRTCLDLSSVQRWVMPPGAKPSKPILFGSSYNGRANGLTGLVACKDLGVPLWHHDRSTGYDYRNQQLPLVCGLAVDKEIPHTHWYNWLLGICEAYIAVHPMPAAAAGRDQIAFAALGIPCIGNAELDIQRELFPELCVYDLYDPRPIRRLAQQLLRDDEFYAHCRTTALNQIARYDLPAAHDQANSLKRLLRW